MIHVSAQFSKSFLILLVCAMYGQLKGDPGTCVDSYTELEDFLLQLFPLQYFPHTLQPTGSQFPVPLPRKKSGVSIRVLAASATSEVQLHVRGHAQGNAVREKKKKKSSKNSFSYAFCL